MRLSSSSRKRCGNSERPGANRRVISAAAEWKRPAAVAEEGHFSATPQPRAGSTPRPFPTSKTRGRNSKSVGRKSKPPRNKIKARRNEIQIRRNEIQISLPSMNSAFSMFYRRLRPGGPAKPARRPFAAARTDSEHRARPFVKKMSIFEKSSPRRSRPPHPAFRLATRQAHERPSALRQCRIRSDGGNGDPEPGQWASLNFGFRRGVPVRAR